MKQTEINALIYRWQTKKCQKSANVLIQHYEEDVSYYVNRYPFGDREDREGAAYLGFSTALDKFKLGQGAIFRTYLSYCIRTSILKGIKVDKDIIHGIDVETLQSDENVLDNVLYRQYLAIIRKNIESTDPKTFLILYYYFTGTMTYVEIGEKVGITNEAVRLRLKKFFILTGIEALDNACST